MIHTPVLANLRFLAAIGIVGIFLHAAAPAALAQDADNDGIPDASDPCAADALNACFGPVAVDNTALGDILTEPNTLKRFLEASATGQAALEELGARVRAQFAPPGAASP